MHSGVVALRGGTLGWYCSGLKDHVLVTAGVTAVALEDVENLLLVFGAEQFEPQLPEKLLLIDLFVIGGLQVGPLAHVQPQHPDPLFAVLPEVELQTLPQPQHQEVVFQGLAGHSHDLGRLVQVYLGQIPLRNPSFTCSLTQPSR